MSEEPYFVGPADSPDEIRIGAAVASGAEGVLYAGEMTFGKGTVEVAVKMLLPGHLQHIEVWSGPWLDQAALLSRIALPGLVSVRRGFMGSLPHRAGAADESSRTLYLVMDWIDGIPLDRWARSVEATEPEQLLLPLIPVAAALDLLHSGAATGGTPLIHGDVKPTNILMRPSGETTLVDVGSVRALEADTAPRLLGTRGYLAPEVVDHGEYSPASDRYALGAVAYFLLTGNEPSPDARTEQLRAGLVSAPLLRDRPELVDHTMAMLNANPFERPAWAANWVAQLRHSSLVALPGDVVLPPRAAARNQPDGPPQATHTPHRRRRSTAVVAVAAVLAMIAAVVAVVSQRGNGHDPDSERPTRRAASLLATTTTGPFDYLVAYRSTGAAEFPLKRARPYIVERKATSTHGAETFSVELKSARIVRKGMYDGEFAPAGKAYFHFVIRYTAIVGELDMRNLTTPLVVGWRWSPDAHRDCKVKMHRDYCEIPGVSGSEEYDSDPAARAIEISQQIIPVGHWAETDLTLDDGSRGIDESIPPEDFIIIFKDEADHVLTA